MTGCPPNGSTHHLDQAGWVCECSMQVCLRSIVRSLATTTPLFAGKAHRTIAFASNICGGCRAKAVKKTLGCWREVSSYVQLLDHPSIRAVDICATFKQLLEWMPRIERPAWSVSSVNASQHVVSVSSQLSFHSCSGGLGEGTWMHFGRPTLVVAPLRPYIFFRKSACGLNSTSVLSTAAMGSAPPTYSPLQHNQ